MQTNRHPLRIGIACYPTFGGSGVVASEIGREMANRGHSVHFISYDVPRRLQGFTENIYFHQVVVRDYPLFTYPPYSVALASKLVDTSLHEELDIIHVHYGVPHAASAFLAREVLGERAPKIVTTLHGTDITLVGRDPSYLPITRFSIMKSDAVTVPSEYLKETTYEEIGIPHSFPIEVVHNFVDTERFSTGPCPEATAHIRRLFPDICSEKVAVHVSNFRPVKRVHDVITAFSKVCTSVPSRLIMVGDGPDRPSAEELTRILGIESRVCFLGNQSDVISILKASTAFIFPSESESFGLAALEAMACGVPVVAARAGGIPEVVVHGETGFLSEIGDTDSMAENIWKLFSNERLHAEMSSAARERVVSCFPQQMKIQEYEDVYYRLLGVVPNSSLREDFGQKAL